MSEEKKKNYRRTREGSESDPEEDCPVSKKVAKLDSPSNDERPENEEDELDYEHDDDQEEEVNETEPRRFFKCQCSTVERQEREIQSLKRQLLQKNVYEGTGENGKEESNREDDLWTRVVGLETKMDTVIKALTSSKKEEEQPAAVAAKGSDFQITSLHSKVDKCMRMILEVTEGLQKTTKFIKQIQKAEEKSEKEEERAKQEQMTKMHTARFSTAGCVKALTAVTVEEPKPVRQPVKAPSPPPSKPKAPEPEEKHAWGTNMLLVGDTLWCALSRLGDVKAEVDEMVKTVGFRLGQMRDSVYIGDLVDKVKDQFGNEQVRVKFPIPQRFKTVGISVGATDLLTDTQLKTLEDGPIGEVKKNNASVLARKAHMIRKLAEKLMSMGRSVVVVIPPFGHQRREIFQQWRDTLLHQCDDLEFPKFRTLDLLSLMNSTQPQFKNALEMLEAWMSDRKSLQLSDFGTRRLFDALKRCMVAKNKQTVLNARFLTGDVIECLRCAKFHQGGPDKCKSKDRACRRCGVVGHFDTLHSLIDMEMRKRIVGFLGVDIYSMSVVHQDQFQMTNGGSRPAAEGGGSQAATYIGPKTEREMNDSTMAVNYDPAKVQAYTSDWYH